MVYVQSSLNTLGVIKCQIHVMDEFIWCHLSACHHIVTCLPQFFSLWHIKSISEKFTSIPVTLRAFFLSCHLHHPSTSDEPPALWMCPLKGTACILRGLYWERADSRSVQESKNNQEGLLQVPGTPERQMMMCCVFFPACCYPCPEKWGAVGMIDENRTWMR